MSIDSIKKQEEAFWNLIAIGVAKKMNWKYPFICNTAKAIDLQDDMSVDLYDLAKRNSLVYNLCKLAKNGSTFKGYPMTSSILAAFPFNKTGVSRGYTKNRFTFYVAEKSLEDFIKKWIQKMT